MHVAKAQIEGNSLLGLYILPFKDTVLVGCDIPESLQKTISEVFDAKIRQVSIAGTPLLGVFGASDGEKMIVPHIIFDHEKQALEDAGIDYKVVKSDLTCFGNNIAVTRHGMLANPEYEKETIEEIEAFFNITATPFTFEETPTIGSFLVHNSTHGLVTHDFSEETLQQISDILGLVLTTGTVNMGSGHVKSGVAVNDAGFLIGENSGGPEVINADEALGFTDEEDEDSQEDENNQEDDEEDIQEK